MSSTPTTRLTTTAVDAREGFDYWNDAVSSTFVPLECRTGTPAGFQGEIVNVSLGDVQLSLVTAAPHQVQRTRRGIARNDPGLLKVCLQLRGSGRIGQDGREAEMRPGDFTLYDTTRPYTLSFDDPTGFGAFVVMFPGDGLGLPRDTVNRLTAIRVSGTDGLGAVVSPFMRALAETMGTEAEVLPPRIALNVLALLETVYRQRAAVAPGEPERVSTARRLAIQEWLDLRLGDPELSPETIAAAHHISLRYLHQLFAEDGTSVSRWIKDRRLEGCRRDLADPMLVRFSVAALAARWGMFDAAVFSRSFRTAFGLSPREYRMRALPRPVTR
ncbi:MULTISPECIES: helix-turn-helix domain-containing protein [unclassified Frankia]|uniref:AraC-like ligand-binding domain-containing protein n=1 Tax=unclassified Frankia TaxID=2632575 RepID=UPI002AD27605|nr:MULTISPECIES: helix-turn-helix domain-containing protein [unclassified Frankia]